MKRTYEVAEQGDKRGLAEFLKRESQFLLPMVERTELAIDEVITVMGRATIEAVLAMSAEGVAGPKQAGKARPAGEAVWYGRQSGQVYLSDRKVRVERPRLRRRGQGTGTGGEVEVPAYEAMNRPGPVGQRMLEILLAGVSTRKYARVIPAMAETVGVSRSAVSRETIEASERVLEELMERRLDGWDLLVIYLDGIQFGDYHVLGAVGVDVEGKKHVLGVREGASENAEVARALLEDLVVRGVDTGRRRLFVSDGSKALRSALDQVFGRQHPVQRCRNHKARNVVGHLPKELQAQARATMRAAWKLEAKDLLRAVVYAPSRAEAVKAREVFARRYRPWYPKAVDVLEDDWERMVAFYDFPEDHWKHLRTTNVVESPFAALRLRTTAAKRFKRVESATALIWKLLLVAEKRFRRLDAPHLLKDVFEGRKFEDGKPVSTQQRKNAA